MSEVFLYFAFKIVNLPMQIKPVQGFCPAQRVHRELRQLIVAQVEGPQGRCNGPTKKHFSQLTFRTIFYNQNQGCK